MDSGGKGGISWIVGGRGNFVGSGGKVRILWIVGGKGGISWIVGGGRGHFMDSEAKGDFCGLCSI